MLVGIAVAILAGYAIQLSSRRGWISDSWVQVPLVATAIACFAGAQALHGSGFIAAFVGGLVFGLLAGKDAHRLVHAAEGTGDTLAMLTWIIFGAALVSQAVPYLTWNVLLYSVLSLTVIRMVPVLVALSGLPLTFGQRNFIGWFGPRGLATVVFAMMVLQSNLPDANLIVATATCVVMLSIIAHGVSAWPIINAMFDTKNSKVP